MTIYDLRDKLNEMCEEGFGSYELPNDFNIWDFIGD